MNGQRLKPGMAMDLDRAVQSALPRNFTQPTKAWWRMRVRVGETQENLRVQGVYLERSRMRSRWDGRTELSGEATLAHLYRRAPTMHTPKTPFHVKHSIKLIIVLQVKVYGVHLTGRTPAHHGSKRQWA